MDALENDLLLGYEIVDAALCLSFKIMTAPQIKLETKILPLQSTRTWNIKSNHLFSGYFKQKENIESTFAKR